MHHGLGQGLLFSSPLPQVPVLQHQRAHYVPEGLIFEGNAHHTVGHAPEYPAQQPRMHPPAPAPKPSLQHANWPMLSAVERRKLRRAASRRAQRARKREAKVVAHEEEKLRVLLEQADGSDADGASQTEGAGPPPAPH